jgi:hypothetical protein
MSKTTSRAFYHFTERRHLDSIMAEGLKPTASVGRNMAGELIPPTDIPVVWLTTRETSINVFQCAPELRIKIELSPSRCLRHWGRWLKRYAPDYLAALNADAPGPFHWLCKGKTFHRGWEEVWLYVSGIIAPSKFKVIDVNPAYDRYGTTERSISTLRLDERDVDPDDEALRREFAEAEKISPRVREEPSQEGRPRSKIRFAS